MNINTRDWRVQDNTTIGYISAPIPKNEYIIVKQIELTDETIDKIAERVVAKLGEKLK